MKEKLSRSEILAVLRDIRKSGYSEEFLNGAAFALNEFDVPEQFTTLLGAVNKVIAERKS